MRIPQKVFCSLIYFYYYYFSQLHHYSHQPPFRNPIPLLCYMDTITYSTPNYITNISVKVFVFKRKRRWGTSRLFTIHQLVFFYIFWVHFSLFITIIFPLYFFMYFLFIILFVFLQLYRKRFWSEIPSKFRLGVKEEEEMVVCVFILLWEWCSK